MLTKALVLSILLVGCGSGDDSTKEPAAAVVDDSGSASDPNTPEADPIADIEALLKASTAGAAWSVIPQTVLDKVSVRDYPETTSRAVSANDKVVSVSFCEGTTVIKSYLLNDLTQTTLIEQCNDLIYNEREKLTLGVNLLNTLSAQAALYAGRKIENDRLHVFRFLKDTEFVTYDYSIHYSLCSDGRIFSISEGTTNETIQTDHTLCPQ